MNKHQILSDIVKSVNHTIWCKEYYYPNISKKVLTKITTAFDPHINTNNIVAFIDTSLFRNCKVGTIYTLNGIYDKEEFKKAFYLKYSDIENYYVQADEKGRTDGLKGTLVVSLKNGTTYGLTNGAEHISQVLDKVLPAIKGWDDLSGGRETGEIQKLGLTENQIKECNAIIHTVAATAGGIGTGLAQIPVADTVALTTLQVGMITTLAMKVFELRITEATANAIIKSATAAYVGRGISQVLWGWIPGAGNAINTATAAGITEMIGWIAVKHFAELNEEDRAKHRIDGMKAGYEAASDEYEVKLRKQAEEFLNQKRLFKEQLEEYEKLLNEYEAYIAKLEKENELLKNTGVIQIPENRISKYQFMKNQYTALKELECYPE